MTNIMHLLWLTFFILFSQNLTQSHAQTLDASICGAPGSTITSFSRCNSLFSAIDVCTKAPSFHSCYCHQTVLNGIVDCNSEERLCAANEYVDSKFVTALSLWHQQCNTFISFTPTTPVLSTITTTYDVNYCPTALEGCVRHEQEISNCNTTFSTNENQFSSCYCQPKIISLGYTCQVLGNVSCAAVPATVTNLAAYQLCTNFCDVLDCHGTKKTVSRTAVTISAKVTSSADLDSMSITAPAIMTSSSATSTSTSATTTSSALRQLVAWETGTLSLVAALVVWIVYSPELY